MKFNELNLIEPILRALQQEGYDTPTPIQQQAIPIVLKGRDLMGCAQTGTGKTCAFAVPILQNLYNNRANENRRKIRCLVVTPTRELAIQIQESFEAYGRHTGLKSVVIFGGVGQKPQTDAIQRGTDILIATPGRLLDLMNQGFITLRDIEYFVLDEADRMLDMGFVHDVKKIIKALPHRRQSLFFSATMPAEIVSLANTILSNPESVSVTPVSSTADTVQQFLYHTDRNNKINLLTDILQDRNIETALVFTRTKHGADKVVRMLIKAGIRSEAIHGNKGQSARQRALSNFKDKTTRVLVATDIAARGIDIDELAWVINYDIPNIPETYVHRIGRTGRAGASGTALSFCEQEERPYIRDIEKLIRKSIPLAENNPFPASSAPAQSTTQPNTATQNKPAHPDRNRPRNGNSGQGNAAGRGDAKPRRKWYGKRG
ncbi:MAG: DEAD/DEAH box helicase [Sphingomonadales bacterium]